MAHEALIALMREQAGQLAAEGVNGTPNLLREAADALAAAEEARTAWRETLADVWNEACAVLAEWEGDSRTSELEGFTDLRKRLVGLRQAVDEHAALSPSPMRRPEMAHEELIATLRWNGENKVWFPADRCSEVADALAAAEEARTAWRETLEAQEDRCAAAEAERDRIQGENERLRILVDEYRTEYVDLDFEKRAAEAERDRYRAATEVPCNDDSERYCDGWRDAMNLVRRRGAALAEPGSEPAEESR